MLETLITFKTRIKLLTKFFLNPQAKAYLRGLHTLEAQLPDVELKPHYIELEGQLRELMGV